MGTSVSGLSSLCPLALKVADCCGGSSSSVFCSSSFLVPSLRVSSAPEMLSNGLHPSYLPCICTCTYPSRYMGTEALPPSFHRSVSVVCLWVDGPMERATSGGLFGLFFDVFELSASEGTPTLRLGQRRPSYRSFPGPRRSASSERARKKEAIQLYVFVYHRLSAAEESSSSSSSSFSQRDMQTKRGEGLLLHDTHFYRVMERGSFSWLEVVGMMMIMMEELSKKPPVLFRIARGQAEVSFARHREDMHSLLSLSFSLSSGD